MESIMDEIYIKERQYVTEQTKCSEFKYTYS